MKIAVCPGSFDPVTLGHIDIIKRAAKMFDRVIVAVMINVNKDPAFTVEERVDILKKSLISIDNVLVESFDGLLIDYAKKVEAVAIVRGLRAVSDFEYEFQMALANKKLNNDIETVFFTTSAQNMYLSSSVVKNIARFNGDISSFVPKEVHEEIKQKLYRKEIKNEY